MEYNIIGFVNIEGEFFSFKPVVEKEYFIVNQVSYVIQESSCYVILDVY